MRIDGATIELRGEHVRILRDAVTIASGRWRKGRIIERSGRLDARDDDAAWTIVESTLRREGDAFVAAAARGAYDARGVDVTQIDRMLALAPAERLAALDGERRSLALVLNSTKRD